MSGATRQPNARPVLTSIAARPLVADLKASCDFFTAKPGFAIDFTYGPAILWPAQSR
jgi:hypothetical protein